MEVNSRTSTELILKSKRWQERETSPERNKIWIEPKLNKTDKQLVSVVYYLSRNGQLDHPHFIEVSLSSSQGLYLRDVLNRLNSLRGKGMASMYSWSSKRSYRNGFVWHDLSENDLITPTHGREYIIKGSELLQISQSFRYYKSPENLPETKSSVDDCNIPATDRRRNQSWSSLDSHRYRVYKAEPSRELAGESADAATQTDDHRRRRRSLERENVEIGEREGCELITELGRDDVSPPLSSSSSKGVSGSGDVDSSADIRDQTAENERPSGRLKASQVLMQLISCGSVSVNDFQLVRTTTWIIRGLLNAEAVCSSSDI